MATLTVHHSAKKCSWTRTFEKGSVTKRLVMGKFPAHNVKSLKKSWETSRILDNYLTKHSSCSHPLLLPEVGLGTALEQVNTELRLPQPLKSGPSNRRFASESLCCSDSFAHMKTRKIFELLRRAGSFLPAFLPFFPLIHVLCVFSPDAH